MPGSHRTKKKRHDPSQPLPTSPGKHMCCFSAASRVRNNKQLDTTHTSTRLRTWSRVKKKNIYIYSIYISLENQTMCPTTRRRLMRSYVRPSQSAHEDDRGGPASLQTRRRPSSSRTSRPAALSNGRHHRQRGGCASSFCGAWLRSVRPAVGCASVVSALPSTGDGACLYRPSTLSWDPKTKRSTGSDQLASWFLGSQAQPIASEECAL